MKRLLIVDDDPDHRLLLRMVLEANGYECAEAQGGGEALTRLKTEHITLVLTDLHMPGINGLQLIDEMRSLLLLEGIPAILMTSQSVAEIISDAFRVGACAVIEKPYNSRSILDTIDSVLGRSEILLSTARI